MLNRISILEMHSGSSLFDHIWQWKEDQHDVECTSTLNLFFRQLGATVNDHVVGVEFEQAQSHVAPVERPNKRLDRTCRNFSRHARHRMSGLSAGLGPGNVYTGPDASTIDLILRRSLGFCTNPVTFTAKSAKTTDNTNSPSKTNEATSDLALSETSDPNHPSHPSHPENPNDSKVEVELDEKQKSSNHPDSTNSPNNLSDISLTTLPSSNPSNHNSLNNPNNPQGSSSVLHLQRAGNVYVEISVWYSGAPNKDMAGYAQTVLDEFTKQFQTELDNQQTAFLEAKALKEEAQCYTGFLPLFASFTSTLMQLELPAGISNLC